jgi:pimeloyl-ACP methyl ester carboxylesterase
MQRGRFRKAGAISAAIAVVATVSWVLTHPGSASELSQPPRRTLRPGPVLPAVVASRPLTVVVRGWLWDPQSRRNPPPLSFFPEQLNRRLRARHGPETTIYQYRWSRIPKDLPAATRDFAAFAEALSEQAARQGRCVNFIGHSAGAAIVYAAAARGVRMGYMGTLGLPTAGTARPPSITQWTNFYTTDSKDLAGVLWGRETGADRNVHAGAPHKELWSSPPVIDRSADGIAAAWTSCHP